MHSSMMGKGKLAIGWVEIEVSIGVSSHSLKESIIKYPEVQNPAMTMMSQRTFPVFEGTLEM